MRAVLGVATHREFSYLMKTLLATNSALSRDWDNKIRLYGASPFRYFLSKSLVKLRVVFTCHLTRVTFGVQDEFHDFGELSSFFNKKNCMD